MATNIKIAVDQYLNKEAKIASLSLFRILFGTIMTIGIIRFWVNGWIEKLYLSPNFHFNYSGFEFIEVPGQFTYLLFVVCGISALMVGIGYRYRLATIIFFLSFTYIELMDKTTYLNHYYFISIVSFILIWLPAHRSYSLDTLLNRVKTVEFIPRWNIYIIKLMLAIVYIYAGYAKLNGDWLLKAMPLTIWLPAKIDMPLFGTIIHEKWLHYAFSWGGAIYDLFIVFFLLWKRTRIFAFGMVVFFHVVTAMLFPIGLFPFVMIFSTLIFFSPQFHEKLLQNIFSIFKVDLSHFKNGHSYKTSLIDRIGLPLLTIFMLFQILLPLRYLSYDGNIFWTEQGYRFAWRVMLMEKTGYANFKIVDGESGKRFYVQNEDFLTAFQQKQMSTQPDFILEYGQYLGNHFSSQGHQNVEVYVESYAALNGRKHQVFVDPHVDLMKVNYTDLCKSHIIPLHE